MISRWITSALRAMRVRCSRRDCTWRLLAETDTCLHAILGVAFGLTRDTSFWYASSQVVAGYWSLSVDTLRGHTIVGVDLEYK